MQQIFFVTDGDSMKTTKKIENFDISKSVFYKVDQLSIYINMLMKNFFDIREINLTADEFKALNFIIEYPNICQRDLAKLMLRDRVRTGRILNSLDEKKYIKRTNDTRNNRLIRKLEITKSGAKIFQEQYRIMILLFNKLLEKFPEKRMNELHKTLEDLEIAISEVVEFNI